MKRRLSYNLYDFQKISLLLFLFIVLQQTAQAQNLSLNNSFFTDYLRNKQLADSMYHDRSFCIRPLAMQNEIEAIDITKKISNHVSLLPLNIITQSNSHHPLNWNNGAMIPAKGTEVLATFGMSAQYGRLSIQLQPELIYAQNDDFETFPTEYAGIIWKSKYQWLNRIDNPEKFGSGTYKKVLPGQSSMYYNLKKISLGVSTENIWWGPGIINSLVMSNNAAGFLHADIHTTQPLNTKIGSFEFQLLSGVLHNSGIIPRDTNKTYNGAYLYQPKYDKSRYMSGAVLSWHPKWVKGLFVGFTCASYLYKKDITSIADISPLSGLIVSESEKENKKASLGSIFLRYILQEENAEIYGEYGRNDRYASPINLITDKNYPGGYIVGFRKLSNMSSNGSRFEFSTEIAQLQLQDSISIQTAQSWYTHNYVRQGFTNDGKILGAGIGPGANSQSIDVSWLKNNSKIGIEFSRVVRNNDFYNNAFENTQDYTRHWVDLSTKFHSYWSFKKFYFNAELQLTRTLNYQYWVLPNANYFKHGYDFLNFFTHISLIYKL